MASITITIGEKADDYFARLETRMKQYDVTAAQLAAATGFDKSQFSRWFGGQTDPGRVAVATIAKIELGLQKVLRQRGVRERQQQATT
jgi:transcriptional regulator with XRE-family HTH domain